MSAVLSKLARRRCYPVKIDTDTYNIRALTIGDGLEFDTITDDNAKIGFMIGCALLNDAGEPEFVRGSDETGEQFGARVTPLCTAIPQDTLAALVAEINKLRKPPAQETLRKNSDATKQPGTQ